MDVSIIIVSFFEAVIANWQITVYRLGRYRLGSSTTGRQETSSFLTPLVLINLVNDHTFSKHFRYR